MKPKWKCFKPTVYIRSPDGESCRCKKTSGPLRKQFTDFSSVNTVLLSLWAQSLIVGDTTPKCIVCQNGRFFVAKELQITSHWPN